MDDSNVIEGLSALAQETRLQAFRRLVAAEPEGIAAGELARLCHVPQNTMSAHLAVLTRAGLVESERHSRSIIYRANLDGFRTMTQYLIQDCCGGHREICAPLIEGLTPCCTPKEASNACC